MKNLKFTSELCEQIVNGDKTATWRLFDDKNLSVGDKVGFLNKDTLEKFGAGEITGVEIRTLGTLIDEDWVGHEQYDSESDMYKTYRGYYGDRVGPHTELKIIQFTFTPISK